MSNYGTQHWPEEILFLKEEKTLKIKFENGPEFRLPAEFLRVMSPSAEVQGHSPAEKKTVSGKKYVSIMGLEAVGNYAVRLIFDDLHDSGMYSWDYLYHLGQDQEKLWAEYLQELAEQNLSRDPVRQ